MIFHHHTLSNGLQIILVPLESVKSVSAGVFFKVGSRYEPASQSGTAHFIEHMLFKGTKRRPTSRLIAEAIEGIGGDSNAYTSSETTVYYAKVAAPQRAVALDFLADLLRQPLFSPADVERERQVIGEEINMVYDSPDEWLEVILDEVIWPDHPLGQSITGTHQTLAQIDRPALLDFFHSGYHPANGLIAIGGAFQPDETIAEIEQLFGDWQPAVPPTFTAAPSGQTSPRARIEHREIEQGHLALALPGLPRAHPNRYALGILNTLLGDGMSSRLFLAIREEKGLAYAVDSGLNFLQDTGSLVIYAGVDPDRGAEALAAILHELERLRDEPIPTAELRKAKEYLKGRLVLGLEDSYSQASWVAYQALFFDRIKTVEEVLAAIEAISEADVKAIAGEIINPSRYNFAAVGPFGRGESLLRLVR